jgi:flagellar L-ring protein FlgH
MTHTKNRCIKLGLVLAATATLSACATADKIASIGKPPPLTRIQNPVEQSGYRPVRLPMPEVKPVIRQANSLWRSGARAFFDDQRAKEVGDILTVDVNITDKAKIDNTTTRSRTGEENVGSNSLVAGVASQISSIIPFNVDPTKLLNTNSESTFTGTGNVDREEELEVSIAAIVTQILPNGNMVVEGRQEIRVNNEVRELKVAGIVRPEDISATNTVSSTQMAEARISYGGRGQISDVQQPRYGQQFLDILLPF